MKNIFMAIAASLLLVACGSDSSTTTAGTNWLYGTYSPIVIDCLDVANGTPVCNHPSSFVLDQTAQLYYPLFSGLSITASSAAELSFKVSNNSAADFDGTLTVLSSFSTNSNTTSYQTLTTDMQLTLAASSFATYTFSIPTPAADDTRGGVTITIKKQSGSVENKGIAFFMISH